MLELVCYFLCYTDLAFHLLSDWWGVQEKEKGYWNRKPLLEACKEKYMVQDLR